jgi:hypothetical protein
VVLRLSPCLECSLCSFGNFPGVWSPRMMEPTLSSETSDFKLQTQGKFPKEHRLQIKSCKFKNTQIQISSKSTKNNSSLTYEWNIFMCFWPCILVIFHFMFQLNAPFVYYIYQLPLRVSSNTVLIIRRIHCIHTASGSLYVTLLRWPLSAQAVRGLARQSSNCCALSGHLRRVTYKEPDAVYIQ